MSKTNCGEQPLVNTILKAFCLREVYTARASMTEEPDAGKPHVLICMGALGNWCSYHAFYSKNKRHGYNCFILNNESVIVQQLRGIKRHL
ncbi:MAG: hypothetical protein ACI945_001326 [Pseudohongiellaceae bacterium]|jgi:hypothetical protein